jgi:single-strand DNA-binding protein
MSSRCLNKIQIVGNLGNKPNFKITQSGTPICTFLVATNRSWKPKNSNEVKEETQWHYVVTFNKLAEICEKVLTKTTKVFVSGRLQTRQFVDDNGEQLKKTEIVASQVIGLDKRKKKIL